MTCRRQPQTTGRHGRKAVQTRCACTTFHLLHGTCDSTRLVIVRRPHNAHGQALLLGQVRRRAGRQRGGHVHVQERQRSVHLQVLARRVRRQRHRPHRRRRAAEPASAAQRTRESSRMKPTGRTCGSAACACGYVPGRTRQPTRRGRRSRWTRPSSEPQWRGGNPVTHTALVSACRTARLLSGVSYASRAGRPGAHASSARSSSARCCRSALCEVAAAASSSSPPGPSGTPACAASLASALSR